jgi:Galactose oxidase, central domain
VPRAIVLVLLVLVGLPAGVRGPVAAASPTAALLEASAALAGPPASTQVRPAALPLANSHARVWTNITADQTAQPPGASGEAATWDAALDGILCFGGLTGSFNYTDETWLYQNGSWSELHPANDPPPLEYAALAYDPLTGYALLFGGFDPGTNAYVNATWTFGNNTWTALHLANSPPPRETATMAYDPNEGGVVMFGGDAGGSDFDDTWLFGPEGWTPIVGSAPSAVFLPSMAYDATDSAIVLFGGTFSNGTGAEYTWLFRNGVWTGESRGLTPPGDDFSSMTSDPVAGGVVLYEVADDGSADYTYAFANDSWFNLTRAGGHSTPDMWGNVEEDPQNDAIVYVGGYLREPQAPKPLIFPETLVLHEGITAGIGAIPASAHVETGQSVAFAALVDGGIGGYEYAWNASLPNCTGTTSAELVCGSIPNGTFTVQLGAWDPEDVRVVATLDFEVNAHVAISTPIVSRSFADVGQPVQFLAIAVAGVPQISITWSGLPPGCPGTGAIVGPCPPQIPGNFSVRATALDSAGGSVTSGTVELAVYADPTLAMPVIATGSAEPAFADEGGTARISTSLTSPGAGGPYNYTWMDLPPACGGNTTALAACPLTATGSYGTFAEVTDAAGFTALSALALLTVNPALTIGLPSSDANIVAGSESGWNVSVSGGTAPYNVTWSAGGTFLGSGVQTGLVFPTSGAGSITVLVRDAVGDRANRTIPVQVGGASSTNGPGLLGSPFLAAGIVVLLIAIFTAVLLRRPRAPAPMREGDDSSLEEASPPAGELETEPPA